MAKKEVFRKSALEKISSPDQLDKVLKVTSPMSWLALLGITLILVFVVVWSFTGYLPTTITATGMIVRSNTSTNTVLSTQRGTVQSLPAGVGTAINKSNNTVMVLSTATGNETITTDLLGTVTEVLVKPGEAVDNNAEILRVNTQMSSNQKETVVCYVPVSDMDKIKRGMEVTVSLDSADSKGYGHMSGRVINIDTWAASQKAIAAVVGNDNAVANMILGDGKSVCAVACELNIDPRSRSGYAWSNEKGIKEAILSAPQQCTVKIVTERVHPITKLFAQLKDIWENK
ncbi:MAG: HlyD family efflux transporter periplasmic adaptor subunit [Clostridia bacterium]|nr:HlyD family efflux transporter periplasmic adaptor subunit [Clostridia bacterium]